MREMRLPIAETRSSTRLSNAPICSLCLLETLTSSAIFPLVFVIRSVGSSEL
jgi:hypothetical protein